MGVSRGTEQIVSGRIGGLGGRGGWGNCVTDADIVRHNDTPTLTPARAVHAVRLGTPQEHAGWDRADPTSWTTESFDSVADVYKGILYKRGIGQSDFQWFVRTLPGVRAVFEEVWGTDELLTSFDGCNVFRPWHNEALAHTKTLGGWWHVDQGKNKIGRHAVQGG